MKTLKKAATLTFTISILATAVIGYAADQKKAGKAKPYPLQTCVVSGEKLGGMGDPYVFVYEGQEIKLCCKGCLPDFKKDPAKYLKKIQEAEKKAAK